MAKKKKELQAPQFSNLYEDIEALAKRIDMDVDDLCALAGVHRTTVSRWEKEKPKTIKIIESILLAVNTKLIEQGKGNLTITIEAVPSAA